VEAIANKSFVFVLVMSMFELLCGCVDMGKNQQNVLVAGCANNITQRVKAS
jgi:hypothetical protein